MLLTISALKSACCQGTDEKPNWFRISFAALLQTLTLQIHVICPLPDDPELLSRDTRSRRSFSSTLWPQKHFAVCLQLHYTLALALSDYVRVWIHSGITHNVKQTQDLDLDPTDPNVGLNRYESQVMGFGGPYRTLNYNI